MIEINTEENQAIIFDFLIQTGCCKRCALRFVGGLEINYDNISSHIAKITSSQNGSTEHTIKKFKANPCIICLDLLQDTTMENMIASPDIEKLSEYDSDTFVNYISFPRSVLIREHSMEIYVKEKFPNFFKDRHILALNRAWSWSIQNKLALKLGKKFDKNSNLQVTFHTSYELEGDESSIMYQLEQKLKKSNGRTEALSNKNVTESLKTIDTELFKKYVSLPPQTPAKAIILTEITYKHDYNFIAGRYCKYARHLFQTPWAGDDIVITHSVQEIIFEALGNIFNCSGMVFSSSGREDFDVRTLGRGRPFFIKLCDPKITKIPFEQFRQIENVIKESKLMAVRDLQFIDKKFVNNIKEGEQFKKKSYRALCIINKPENLETYINKINLNSEITLEQKTPLRVFHRRSSDAREKKIYSIKARAVSGRENLFELDMVTQAGTYIKEFVHGDFGRTTPSLSQIIDGYVDILALDVLDIDLNFPPAINYKRKIKKEKN